MTWNEITIMYKRKKNPSSLKPVDFNILYTYITSFGV